MTYRKQSRTGCVKSSPEIGDLSSTKNLSVKNYFNFEKATVKGFEVNLNGNLFPGFTLAGNYTYAYGRGLNEGGEWQNIERSIRHTATITGNYTHSWSDYTLNLNLERSSAKQSLLSGRRGRQCSGLRHLEPQYPPYLRRLPQLCHRTGHRHRQYLQQEGQPPAEQELRLVFSGTFGSNQPGTQTKIISP